MHTGSIIKIYSINGANETGLWEIVIMAKQID
jgi:hypothetical protein